MTDVACIKSKGLEGAFQHLFPLAFPFRFVSYATNQMIFFAWQSHSWLTIFSLSHQCGLLNLEIVEGYIARQHADLVLSSDHEAITFMSFGMVNQLPHPLPVSRPYIVLSQRIKGVVINFDYCNILFGTTRLAYVELVNSSP